MTLRILDLNLEQRVSVNGGNTNKMVIPDRFEFNEDYDAYEIHGEGDELQPIEARLRNEIEGDPKLVISFFSNVYVFVYPGIDGVTFLAGNSKLINEQLAYVRPQFINDLMFSYVFRRHRVKTIGRAFVPFDAGIINFYHYMVLCLPKIKIKEQIAELSTYPTVLPRFANFARNERMRPGYSCRTYRDALRLFQINGRNIKYLDIGIYHVEELALLHWNVYPRYDVVFTKSFQGVLSGIKAPEYQSRDSYRVFLSRRNSGSRRPIDRMEDVIRKECGEGFHVVCPDELSLWDQMKLVGEAGEIRGLHGAAFTNLLFRKNNNVKVHEYASLPENQKSNTLGPHFLNIGKIKDMEYHFHYIPL